MVTVPRTKTKHAPGGREVTLAEYERIALSDLTAGWELHDGRLRRKPAMSWDHTNISFELGHRLRLQLDPSEFRVQVDGGRLRRAPKRVYVPDVMVVPTAYGIPFRGADAGLAMHVEPVPLVVEVWSPSTGGYDVDAKFPLYQARGDQEIWRIHPYQRTVTIWRKQDDGSYITEIVTGGIVSVASLPGVSIDLDDLFRSM